MARISQAVTKGTITKVKAAIRTTTIHGVRTVAISAVTLSISIILREDTDRLIGIRIRTGVAHRPTCVLWKTRTRETK